MARVLLLVQNLPVPFDRRVWQEGKALRDGGHDVTIISPADDRLGPTNEDLDGIRVVRYRAPKEASSALGYPIEYAWALGALLIWSLRMRRRGRFDVIHYCNPPDLLFLVALPFRIVDRSITIFDQHDLGPELAQAKHLPAARLWERIFFALERMTYRCSDYVISTNESYKRIALARGHKAAAQVQVVRSGPSIDWVRPGRIRPELRNGRETLVAYLGVMGRQEGIEYLLEAARELVQVRGLDVQFVLVGSGPDRDRLEALSIEYGLADHVTFMGRVSDDDLRSALTTADICVNPDEVNDMNNLSTMNKIMEYMAMEKPIVQFDVVEGRFSAGGSSLYASPNDSMSFADRIEELHRSPELRRRMGEIGSRRFREELSWEVQAEALRRFYARALGSVEATR